MPFTEEPVDLEVLKSFTVKKKCNCGNVYVTIGIDKDKFPRKVVSRVGKAGGCAVSYLEAIGRLITRALEHGDNPREIARSLGGLKCNQGNNPSCADCVSKSIAQLLDSGEIVDGQAKEEEDPAKG